MSLFHRHELHYTIVQQCCILSKFDKGWYNVRMSGEMSRIFGQDPFMVWMKLKFYPKIWKIKQILMDDDSLNLPPSLMTD